MKPLTLILSLFFTASCFAQDLVSAYKPKTKEERLVIAKLKSLPEIKDLYARPPGKDYKFDIMIDPPDSQQKNYRFQVGTDHADRFATSCWLSIDPKTLRVYYWDFLDTANSDISLQQWRRWRNDPRFQDNHTWKNGKLIVIKYKKHVQKKSSHT